MKVTQKITDLILTSDGGCIVVTSPSVHNAKGAFRLNAIMLASLVLNAGCANAQDLKLSIKDASFSFESTAVKAGEAWVNTKTGETGAYTKDHSRITNQAITLGEEQINQIRILSRVKSIDLSSVFSVGRKTVAKGEEFVAAPTTPIVAEEVVVAEAEPADEVI